MLFGLIHEHTHSRRNGIIFENYQLTQKYHIVSMINFNFPFYQGQCWNVFKTFELKMELMSNSCLMNRTLKPKLSNWVKIEPERNFIDEFRSISFEMYSKFKWLNLNDSLLENTKTNILLLNFDHFWLYIFNDVVKLKCLLKNWFRMMNNDDNSNSYREFSPFNFAQCNQSCLFSFTFSICHRFNLMKMNSVFVVDSETASLIYARNDMFFFSDFISFAGWFWIIHAGFVLELLLSNDFFSMSCHRKGHIKYSRYKIDLFVSVIFFLAN